MKRFLSWVVLGLSIFISAKIIQFIVYTAIRIAAMIHDSHPGLFWVIIFVGGSFGLGLAYYFSMLAAHLCVNISQKIKPSVKGTRYVVGAIILGLLFIFDLVLCFRGGMSGIVLARQIIFVVFILLYAFLLFFFGKGKAYED